MSYYDDDDLDLDFADPGGESALRAATPTNPRNQPCPTCGRANVLTPRDVKLRYQCDRCAREVEQGW
jgi:ribosomal protein S27AE